MVDECPRWNCQRGHMIFHPDRFLFSSITVAWLFPDLTEFAVTSEISYPLTSPPALNCRVPPSPSVKATVEDKTASILTRLTPYFGGYLIQKLHRLFGSTECQSLPLGERISMFCTCQIVLRLFAHCCGYSLKVFAGFAGRPLAGETPKVN